MTGIKRVGTLDINEDMDYQQRMWVIQRVGWVIFALILLAALLGLFGRGPMSVARLEAAGVEMNYERFVRMLAPMVLEIELPAQGAQQEEARFWISGDFLESITIEQITPEPKSVEFSGAGQLYVFDVEQPGQRMLVTINAKPEKLGPHGGLIGADANTAAPFSQFVYP